MPDENDNTADAPETEAKPTITIAEKQSGETADAKPTITIAEKQKGE
ncbi:MAG TPA: hypothetical protein VJV05_00990 [Pyrinomonadaceae bacterium]|nr:hypothetical protein [Pyrinomonadaceae bacterium]